MKTQRISIKHVRIGYKVTLVSVLCCFTFFFYPTPVNAQQKIESKRKLKKRSKQVEKKREEDREAELNISEDLRNQHKSNQTKAVRKRMKKNKKRAKRYNDNKKSFFLVRWYKKVAVKIQAIF